MTFPCTQCGACCRRVGLMDPGWPWLAVDGRTCSKLGVDNTCTIYADRPLVCRVDEMIDLVGGFDRTTWYRLTADICNAQQVEDGMAESYRVKVEET